MKRRREIAASPQRSAAQAWEKIRSLVCDTLERSASIERVDVEAALTSLDGVARMLISAGHLEKHSLVLVADELWLEIQPVSGGPALKLEENFSPVPGAASATDWTLFVPQIQPMTKLVRAAVKEQPHLSADEPTGPAEAAASTAKAPSAIEFDALERWAKDCP